MESSSRIAKFLGASISGTGEVGIDRISHLPDEVIHNILLLSDLYIFDAVQLSVFSKKWNRIWRTMPYLDFDINRFGCERVKRPWDWEMVDTFKSFINWVLIYQCTMTTLVRFKLCCGSLFDKLTILRWIRATTMRNIQQLVLSFCPGDSFELQLCVSTCGSLQVLKLDLSGAILKLPNHLGFRQLKLLHLHKVQLSNEHLTSCLFSKCPLLESLILAECTLGTMTILAISSTSLVNVQIENHSDDGRSYRNCNVKVSCPNLKIFKYSAPMAKDIALENLFSVQVVHIFFYDMGAVVLEIDPYARIEEISMLVNKMIKNVPATSVLKLCMVCVRGLFSIPHVVKNSTFTLYKLKCLKLAVGMDKDCIKVMILLLKHSPNLEMLNLWSDNCFLWGDNWKLQDPSEGIMCLESHLKLIKLTDFKYEKREMELLKYFLKNARVLEKLIIVLDKDVEREDEASEEVLHYPRTSPHVVVTFSASNMKKRRWSYEPFS